MPHFAGSPKLCGTLSSIKLDLDKLGGEVNSDGGNVSRWTSFCILNMKDI
ncbi:hypothetical protein FG05_35414 [Fusarium graminearum]|nr:hypothetical protein FG05_35414 [Fusarium graminearum]